MWAYADEEANHLRLQSFSVRMGPYMGPPTSGKS